MREIYDHVILKDGRAGCILDIKHENGEPVYEIERDNASGDEPLNDFLFWVKEEEIVD